MTDTATRTTEITIGITPRPRFVDVDYDTADEILVDELRPLGDAANNYGWYGGHGYKDLPDLTEDLHNRRNVLGAAYRLTNSRDFVGSAFVVGTSSFTSTYHDIGEAQRVEGAKVIYLVTRQAGGQVLFTEVA